MLIDMARQHAGQGVGRTRDPGGKLFATQGGEGQSTRTQTGKDPQAIQWGWSDTGQAISHRGSNARPSLPIARLGQKMGRIG